MAGNVRLNISAQYGYRQLIWSAEAVDEKVLAFVDIFVDSLMIDEVLRDLNAIDNVIEIYEVTGEFDIVTLIRSDNIEEFRNILKNRVMKIKGIKSTVSSIVLSIDKISQRNSE